MRRRKWGKKIVHQEKQEGLGERWSEERGGYALGMVCTRGVRGKEKKDALQREECATGGGEEELCCALRGRALVEREGEGGE